MAAADDQPDRAEAEDDGSGSAEGENDEPASAEGANQGPEPAGSKDARPRHAHGKGGKHRVNRRRFIGWVAAGAAAAAAGAVGVSEYKRHTDAERASGDADSDLFATFPTPKAFDNFGPPGHAGRRARSAPLTGHRRRERQDR